MIYDTQPLKLATPGARPNGNGADTLSTLLEALQPFPEARAAIVEAFRRKLGLEKPGA